MIAIARGDKFLMNVYESEQLLNEYLLFHYGALPDILPWDFGPRKTKELMLTGDAIDADEAHKLGMVSKIFPNDQLEEKTLEFARRIAKVPTMASLLVKEAVNQTVDNMGFHNALNACFTLHELNHAHWAWSHENKYPVGLPEDGIDWKNAPPVVLAEKDSIVGTNAQ